MSYANDFPPFWPGNELIIGSSLGVPTRKRADAEIGSATPLGKGKEKKGKKGAKGKPETEKGTEDPELSQGTKKRKTSTASKQLPTLKEFKEVASIATRGRSLSKEVSHSSMPKIKVKTKVEISKSQTFVSSLKGISSIVVYSLAQGSLGSFTMIPCSPEGLFRQTCSKWKIDVDPI